MQKDEKEDMWLMLEVGGPSWRDFKTLIRLTQGLDTQKAIETIPRSQTLILMY